MSPSRKTEMSLQYLSSYPLLNPNPVIESDKSGSIFFANPATGKILKTLGSVSDPRLFLPADYKKILGKKISGHKKLLTFYREITIRNRVFAEDLYLLKNSRTLRIYARDITAYKESERILKENDFSLKKSAEIARLGSWELNAVTGILNWSDEVYKIFGLKQYEFKATYEAFLEMVHPDDRNRVDRKYRKSLTGGQSDKFDVEHRIIQKSTGKVRYIREKCRHFRDKSGIVTKSVGIVYDITERVNLLKQKDEFIGIASHELKTPLTTIKAFSQLLLKKCPGTCDVGASMYLQKIDYQVDRLISLVNDLLDTTKIREGKLVLPKKKFSLDNLIGETIQVVRMIYQEANKQIEFSVKSGQTVTGDRDRITRVLYNLLTNACEFSPGKEKIIVRTEIENGQAVVSVQDFGVGIPQDKQKHLFEPYFQVNPDHPSSGKLSSMGLGLYISSEIIRRHGGKMWFKSTERKGSTFFFSLPV
jgi:PAS domain S-box-containing protein